MCKVARDFPSVVATAQVAILRTELLIGQKEP